MRRGVAVGLLAALGIVAAVRWLRRDEFALTPRLVLEDVAADLSGTFRRDAVLEEDPAAPVGRGSVTPGDPLAGGAARAAIVAPPASRLRFEVDVPAGAALRFGIGVERPKQREPRKGSVRFAVSVDGDEIWSRVLDPSRRRDRRWVDERLDLGPAAGRRATLVLTTAAEAPAGTPGWSRVRVTRRLERDRQPATPAAPNVIVLLVDTLRADRLGCYGASPSPSPNLDRLAAGGLVFEAAAQSSWTMPSVASLFSGLHPRTHGAWHKDGSEVDNGPGREYLADELVTWAEAAADAGITTVGVSTNPLVSRATNLAQGFETFVELPWDAKARNWAPAAAVDRMFLRWLETNRAHRFAAYLHYMEPHDPYTPPAALRPAPPAGVRPAVAAGWIRDIANELNWNHGPLLRAEEIAHLRQLYDGEISAWDAELDALLAGLARLGVLDSTVILVTADHGEEFQEHGRLTHGSHLYQESIRVPLVIIGPGIPNGRRTDLAQTIDVYPTLVHLLGLPPRELPGRDLLASSEARPVLSETARGIDDDGAFVGVASVRAGGWQLIHTPSLGRFELYDLTRDPEEREDRYGTAAEGEALTRMLVEWEASAPAPRAPSDPALRERLRSLGYVQ